MISLKNQHNKNILYYHVYIILSMFIDFYSNNPYKLIDTQF